MRISKKHAIGIVAVCTGLLSLPDEASATSITYAVDQPLNGTGSIVGTITTDGLIGTLASADIVGWHLNVNDGTNATVFDSSAVGAVVGGYGLGLTASSTQLMYNYSDPVQGQFYFEATSPWTGEICYDANQNCWGPTGVGTWDVNTDGLKNFIAAQGNQVIGTAIPEPLTLSIFGAGFAGAIAMRRRKTKEVDSDRGGGMML